MSNAFLSLLWVPGGQELIIILIVILVLFGGTKLPQLMRGMGTGIKEFKQAIKDDDDKSDKDEVAKG
ncbi:twin-arginine translocase TatA/TatE family subunit [bacterium]|nr:twin-arginine translocase TatA/TatE family subunit [bacterium]